MTPVETFTLAAYFFVLIVLAIYGWHRYYLVYLYMSNRDKEPRQGPPLDPLPVMQQFETFEYAAQALRDPFSEAFSDVSGGSGPRPDPNRPKQTLEQFPLDSMDMVGTIGRGPDLIALVMAPDKVTYRVRPGVYMGQADGRVTAVYEDRIELVELVPDGAGGWLERPASVALEDQ